MMSEGVIPFQPSRLPWGTFIEYAIPWKSLSVNTLGMIVGTWSYDQDGNVVDLFGDDPLTSQGTGYLILSSGGISGPDRLRFGLVDQDLIKVVS